MPILITKVVPPERGWPVALHCRHCRETVIMVNKYALKPENGDYWLVEMTCPKHWFVGFPKFDWKYGTLADEVAAREKL